jgi:hypothetical protein
MPMNLNLLAYKTHSIVRIDQQSIKESAMTNQSEKNVPVSVKKGASPI